MNSEAPEGWQRVRTEGVEALQRRWVFDDFQHTMGFVNAVAALAQRLDHHPDLHVGQRHCTVFWTTHDVGRLTERDLRAAEAVNALPESAQA